MAALIARCRAGRVRGTQVFLVSGGAPTLFAGSPDGAGRPAHGSRRRAISAPGARITSGPAPELVEAGYALEIAEAPGRTAASPSPTSPTSSRWSNAAPCGVRMLCRCAPGCSAC